MVTAKQLRAAMRGRQVFVTVAGTEFQLPISHQKALRIRSYCCGDVAWMLDDEDETLHLFANAEFSFGKTGKLDV